MTDSIEKIAGEMYDSEDDRVTGWRERLRTLAPEASGADYVLVPREPTFDMIDAMAHHHSGLARWKAAISAAPISPFTVADDAIDATLAAMRAASPQCADFADRLAPLLNPAPPTSGGVEWDEGSPCVKPRPVGMVYPPKPVPRASGYLPDGSGVEWNAYDTSQMEAYARAAVALYYAIPADESGVEWLAEHLWHRFGPDHEIKWAEDVHESDKSEYRTIAADILRELAAAPQPAGDLEDAGHE